MSTLLHERRWNAECACETSVKDLFYHNFEVERRETKTVDKRKQKETSYILAASFSWASEIFHFYKKPIRIKTVKHSGLFEAIQNLGTLLKSNESSRS